MKPYGIYLFAVIFAILGFMPMWAYSQDLRPIDVGGGTTVVQTPAGPVVFCTEISPGVVVCN